MSKLIRFFWPVSIVLVLCVLQAQAQGEGSSLDQADQRTGPYPAASQPSETIASDGGSLLALATEAHLVPDARPLTGLQNLTLGGYSNTRNSVIPSLSVVTQADENPPASGYKRVTSVSYVLGRINLNHFAGRSLFSLDYTGGAKISTDGDSRHSAIQDLGLSESFDWKRWSALLGDQISYSSESAFGFGGVGGLEFLGNVSPAPSSLQTQVTPSQLIPTSEVPRLSNTATAQVGYHFNRRSSWTLAGSYGVLRFFQGDYVNSNNAIAQTGYNYQITRESTIAALYRFEEFRFAHQSQAIDDQVMQLSYGRRITGRLSFQVAAGPDLQQFRDPSFGSSSRVSWSMHSGLDWLAGRTRLESSFDHFVTGGSGVLAGAQVDQVQGTIGRDLTRTWKGSMSLGYAENRSLDQTALTPKESHFGNWHGVLRFSHQLSSGADLFLAYGARLQGTNTAACAFETSCARSLITHEISVGFSWGLRSPKYVSGIGI
jgi:hypothetical protein